MATRQRVLVQSHFDTRERGLNGKVWQKRDRDQTRVSGAKDSSRLGAVDLPRAACYSRSEIPARSALDKVAKTHLVAKRVGGVPKPLAFGTLNEGSVSRITAPQQPAGAADNGAQVVTPGFSVGPNPCRYQPLSDVIVQNPGVSQHPWRDSGRWGRFIFDRRRNVRRKSLGRNSPGNVRWISSV